MKEWEKREEKGNSEPGLQPTPQDTTTRNWLVRSCTSIGAVGTRGWGYRRLRWPASGRGFGMLERLAISIYYGGRGDSHWLRSIAVRHQLGHRRRYPRRYPKWSLRRRRRTSVADMASYTNHSQSGSHLHNTRMKNHTTPTYQTV